MRQFVILILRVLYGQEAFIDFLQVITLRPGRKQQTRASRRDKISAGNFFAEKVCIIFFFKSIVKWSTPFFMDEKPILQFQEKPSNIPEIINFSCKSNKNKNVYISSSTVMSKYF